jgi:hypothetical protein
MSTTASHPADQTLDRGPHRQKMTFLYADQQTDLDALARRLHDGRSARGGARITANTLVRVMTDGMLRHGEQLHGDTEAELLDSWLRFLDRAAAGQDSAGASTSE